MMLFRSYWAYVFFLVCCLYSRLGYVRTQDDEVIDLQELLLQVSKDLSAFGRDMREAFKGFGATLQVLDQGMNVMKTTMETVRESSAQLASSNQAIKESIEKSSQSLTTWGQNLEMQLVHSCGKQTDLDKELKGHLTNSVQSLAIFQNILEDQKQESISSFSSFEKLLHDLSLSSTASCAAFSKQQEALFSRLKNIEEVSTKITASNHEVKKELEKTTSSINSIAREQKFVKETLATVNNVTSEIHTINREVQDGGSKCSASIEAFLKEQTIWKETLTEKIDKVVEKHGTCEEKPDGDKDGDPTDNNDKDNENIGLDVGPVKDCMDIYKKYVYRTSGVYNIQPRGSPKRFPVLCDMKDDGGGWTVIQKRGEFGSLGNYFSKSWDEYKRGFGNFSKDFWLGNDNIAAITGQGRYEVKIDLWDSGYTHAFARYNDFNVEKENTQYRLRVTGYSGTAGNALRSDDGAIFSTKDRPNPRSSCPGNGVTGWWHGACDANLNGYSFRIHGHDLEIRWATWLGKDHVIPSTTMKVRPKQSGPPI